MTRYTPQKKHYKRKWDGRSALRVHRLVMEKKLGRKLCVDEVVHHIDGDIYNNNPDNLRLFKNSAEHSRFHYLEQLKSGNEWWKKSSMHRHGVPRTQEVKDKISKAKKGRRRTKEEKIAISIGQRRNPGGAKVCAEDVSIIKKMLNNHVPDCLIAFVYQLSKCAIRDIRLGRTWSWIA